MEELEEFDAVLPDCEAASSLRANDELHRIAIQVRHRTSSTDGSIVRERRVPITLRALWKARDDMSLGLEVGYDVDREYRIEDRNGRNSRSFDTDPGFFFGLRFSYTF